MVSNFVVQKKTNKFKAPDQKYVRPQIEVATFVSRSVVSSIKPSDRLIFYSRGAGVVYKEPLPVLGPVTLSLPSVVVRCSRAKASMSVHMYGLESGVQYVVFQKSVCTYVPKCTK